MIYINDNQEYLYTSKLFVKESFFNYFDYSDPEVQINPLQLSNGVFIPLISSKIFGDKYSARNWIYKKIKSAFDNGATFDDLYVNGFSCVSCCGHRLDLSKANMYWLKFPPDNDESFMTSDDDIEFIHTFNKYLLKKGFKFDLLLDSSNYYLNQLIAQGDQTFNIKGPEEPPFKFESSTQAEIIEQNIENLTRESLSYKSYTIPSNTTVDLRSLSYRHVEIIEENNSVVFIFRENKNYFTLGFNISTGEWLDEYVTLYSTKRSITDKEIEWHKLGVKYIGAILLHDFWVIEYRQRNKIYSPKRAQPILRNHPWCGTDLDGRTNIYMPRIKYFSNESNQFITVDNDNVDLVIDGIFQLRKIHRVAHTRNLEKGNRHPNPEQVLLAEEYGIKVPIGHTFVRPSHIDDNGKFKDELIQRNRIYLSRTALGTLFNVEIFQSTTEIKWLKFQNDCITYCKEILGLQLLPRKIRKRGDEGIDILCFQKKGKSIIYWLIQCKCWSRNRVVGIQILREFFTSGAWTNELSDEQKKSLRYMIITSSKFSSDSDFIQKAIENNIALVDGDYSAQSVPLIPVQSVPL